MKNVKVARSNIQIHYKKDDVSIIPSVKYPDESLAMTVQVVGETVSKS